MSARTGSCSRRARGSRLLAAVTVGVSAIAGVALSAARAEAAPVPSGFQDQTVFGGLTNPTTLRFASDGRVFVAEKSGLIKVFDSLSDPTSTIFADLRTQVHNYWDRGLLGLALDPQFPANPWVYVLYTHDAEVGGIAPRWGSAGVTSDPCPSPPGPTADGCVVSGRVSRLQAAGNTMTGNEQVLIEDWCQQYPSHSVGSLAFGADGALYASAGDGASFNFVDYGQDGEPKNPCGDPPAAVGGSQTPPSAQGGALRSQDLRSSGDPVGLDGTIIRVDPATGQGLPGNPLYLSTDPNARRIVASGLRNPFRFAIRPDTNEVWMGDVGAGSTEEINRLATPIDGAADNFGWPCYEGLSRQPGYDGANLSLCEGLYAGGNSGVVSPIFSYKHSEAVVPNETCPTGSSSLAGVAFAPSGGGSYPAQYRGALFFADFSRRCIWVVPPAANGLPDFTQRETFVLNAVGPVDLQIGPEGELYYVDLGGGAIHRIRYLQAPTAIVTAQPDNGLAPLTVQFDGGASSDVGGGPIAHAWDLDGDGAFDDSTSATPTYTYMESGIYTARLQVTDTDGASDTASVEVAAGNTAPEPVIDVPLSTTTWKVDDQIVFSGHATDAQDGDLPSSALSWSLVLQHCPSTCHAHPLQSIDEVAGGSFVAPDHEYPTHLELRLTATDSNGATRSTTLRLDPQTVAVEVRTDPPGLVLEVGSASGQTPFTRTVISGSVLSLSAPSPQQLGSDYYHFESWSDQGAATHTVVVSEPATYTVRYQPGNLPPVAQAGTDRGVGSDRTFVLDGDGSDPEDLPLSYHWEQVNGPLAVIRDEDQAEATVEGVAGPAALTFRLTVTDSAGQTDVDEVIITVARPK